jgi:hypothetical protein
MKAVATFVFLMGCIAFARPAAAQVPFFNPGASAFSPEISVLNTGVLNDVQATVSADRRYVTLNMRPQQSELINLFEFRIPGPQVTGFVGGVQFSGAGETGEFGAVNAPVILSRGKGTAILHQRGMTRIIVK